MARVRAGFRPYGRPLGSCPVTNRIETVVAEAIHDGSAPLPLRNPEGHRLRRASRYRQLRAQAIGSMLVRVHARVAVLPVRVRVKPSKTRNEVNQIVRALGMDIWLPALDAFRTFAA
jgi:hypothetical protein